MSQTSTPGAAGTHTGLLITLTIIAALGGLLFAGASAFALGLLIGALIALVCLLAKITWQRLKA